MTISNPLSPQQPEREPAPAIMVPLPQERLTRHVSDAVRGDLKFNLKNPAERVAFDLLQVGAVQRLRDVGHLGFTNLVYPGAEGSRMPHLIGSAWLVNHALGQLKENSHAHKAEIERWSVPVSAAIALHDVGHIAPGSHIAWRVWFPDGRDHHEEHSARFVREDPEIRAMLSSYGSNVIHDVLQILDEDSGIPPWTWQIVSGGAWNADRGDWLPRDQQKCSMEDITKKTQFLLNALRLTDSEPRHLAVDSCRVSALEDFLRSRDVMYAQVYGHRVSITADLLAKNIVRRVRELVNEGEKPFLMNPVKAFIETDDFRDIPLSVSREMTESAWGFHLQQWGNSPDPILNDFVGRLRFRKLLKNIQVPTSDTDTPEVIEARRDYLLQEAQAAVQSIGLSPDYYALPFKTQGKRKAELDQALRAVLPDGKVVKLDEASHEIARLFEPRTPKHYIAVPEQVRDTLVAAKKAWLA